MQKTANYQLNQWVKSDRIQMEDFNSDNAKIDAALKALAGKSAFTLLKTVTVPEGGSSCQLDVSDVDWSQWQYVLLDLDLKGVGTVHIKPNGTNSGNWSSASSSTEAGMLSTISAVSFQRLTFSIAKSPARTIRIRSEDNVYGGNNELTYADLNTLDLTGSSSRYSAGAGAAITLWGVG